MLYSGTVIAALLVILMLFQGSPGQLAPLEFAVIGFWMLLGVIANTIRQRKDDMSQAERSYMILGDYR